MISAALNAKRGLAGEPLLRIASGKENEVVRFNAFTTVLSKTIGSTILTLFFRQMSTST